MLNGIINFTTFERKSKVIFYKETTKNGSRFGVQYHIGDDIDDSELDMVKSACDTIAYREHYKVHLGKYPENDLNIYFRIPGRVCNISFMDISSIDVYRVAELIAEYLKVRCSTEFSNPLIVTT